MRSLVSEKQSVGLLLFDEPSAALDPNAEHGTGDGCPLNRVRSNFVVCC